MCNYKYNKLSLLSLGGGAMSRQKGELLPNNIIINLMQIPPNRQILWWNHLHKAAPLRQHHVRPLEMRSNRRRIPSPTSTFHFIAHPARPPPVLPRSPPSTLPPPPRDEAQGRARVDDHVPILAAAAGHVLRPLRPHTHPFQREVVKCGRRFPHRKSGHCISPSHNRIAPKTDLARHIWIRCQAVGESAAYGALQLVYDRDQAASEPDYARPGPAERTVVLVATSNRDFWERHVFA